MARIVETFQQYVAVYSDQAGYVNYKDRTFIDDMIYGIGLAIDEKEYKWFDGYKRWKKYLRTEIIGK
jgi:hypothetical protein